MAQLGRTRRLLLGLDRSLLFPQEELEKHLAAAGVSPAYARRDVLQQLRVLVFAGASAMKERRAAEAVRQQREARELCLQHGLHREAVTMALVLGGYTLQGGAVEAALEVFAEARRMAEAHDFGDLAVQAQMSVASTLLVLKRPDEAATAYGMAGELGERAGALVLAIEGFRMCGQLHATRKRDTEATAAWRRALDVADRASPMEKKSSTAPDTARQLATLCRKHGLTAQAESLESLAATMEAAPLEPEVGATPSVRGRARCRVIQSTFMDPVMGLDTHLVAVPSPAGPIPTPVPMPFVGMVFDPAGLMVGAAIGMATGGGPGLVLVNGVPATNVGTGVTNKLTLPHLPVPGVAFIPPPAPGNDAELMFGSLNVSLGGSYGVRLGDMAISCGDPVRLPTSVVLAIPKGPPVLNMPPMAPDLGRHRPGRGDEGGRGGPQEASGKLQKRSKAWSRLSSQLRVARRRGEAESASADVERLGAASSPVTRWTWPPDASSPTPRSSSYPARCRCASTAATTPRCVGGTARWDTGGRTRWSSRCGSSGGRWCTRARTDGRWSSSSASSRTGLSARASRCTNPWSG